MRFAVALALLVAMAASLAVAANAPVDLAAAGECRSCHESEWEQWRGSRHAASFTNALFMRDFRRHGRAWCLECHVPSREARVALMAGDASGAADGIDCAACHLRDGALVTRRVPTERGIAAHPLRQDASLGSPAFCASCHQFDLPGSGLAMQDTFEEWRRSRHGAAGVGCADCHLRGGDHSMPGAHDATLVRGAIEIGDVVADGTRTRVTLRASGAGHGVPTGDVFRSIALQVCADPACGEVTGEASAGRWLIAGANGFELVDRAIPPDGERELVARGRGAFYRVLYRYSGDEDGPALVLDSGAVTEPR